MPSMKIIYEASFSELPQLTPDALATKPEMYVFNGEVCDD
jgi:hypothetical protein